MNSEKKTVQLKLNSYLNTLYLETLLNNTHGSLAQTVSINKVLFQTGKKKMFRKLFGGHCKVCVTVKCNFCNSFRLRLLVFNF